MCEYLLRQQRRQRSPVQTLVQLDAKQIRFERLPPSAKFRNAQDLSREQESPQCRLSINADQMTGSE